jgi:hypothetical protein
MTARNIEFWRQEDTEIMSILVLHPPSLCYCGQVVWGARPSQGPYPYAPPPRNLTADKLCYQSEIRSCDHSGSCGGSRRERLTSRWWDRRRSSSEIISVSSSIHVCYCQNTIAPDARGTWHPSPGRFILLSMFCVRKASANVVLYFSYRWSVNVVGKRNQSQASCH